MSDQQVDNSTIADTNNAATGEPAETLLTSESVKDVDFKSQLSDEYRDHKSLNNFKDINDLVKSYIHAQQMIGGSIRIPGEDAGQEQRDEFYKKLQEVDGVVRLDKENLNPLYDKLGRPESPDKYELSVPEELLDTPINPEIQGQFQKLAHEIGLNSDQASKILAFDLARQKQQMDINDKLYEESKSALKNEFGDEFNNIMDTAKATLDKLSTAYPDLKNLIDTVPQAANSAGLTALLAKYGKSMVEKGSEGYKGVGRIGVTPEEAKQRINEKKLNKEFMDAWLTPNHPSHKAAVEDMNQLYELAYPKVVE